MNEIFQSIILGLAQGLGEFLPISSSGHLVILPWLFGFSDPGLAFDVALHLGTLIAVLVYFWRDIIIIFKLALKNNFKFKILNFKKSLNDKNLNDENRQYNSQTLWFLVIATVPGVVFGYFLESYAETFFRHPLLVAFALSSVGLILYLADKYARHKKPLNNLTWKDSIIIGFSQALAIIPGVSRSGATITTGLFLGLDRVSAARFSFLLSTPIIFGAAILKLPNLLTVGLNLNILVGVLVSAISGFLAIKYLIKLVEKISYKVFFWYRLALAALIITVYFLR